MYVAVKGGEKAILNSHQLLAEARRGDPAVPELTVEQIEGQLSLAVDRVMAEGSLYDRELAALAVKQSWGDLVEAVFLLRAYRTTLPRLGLSSPLDTSAMHVRRRVSAIFKDLPGGQVLGPTFDYTHRLLDFSLAHPDGEAAAPVPSSSPLPKEETTRRALDFLETEELVRPDPPADGDLAGGDLTREPLQFPAERDVRLQNLARGDEGFLLALSYSVQRGFGKGHPFVGEIRVGEVPVVVTPEELGFPVEIGEITVTECSTVCQFVSTAGTPPVFTQGYGLTFGFCERKAMAMSLVDRALRSRELGEEVESPAQDEEFVLYHSDNVEASGFLQHLKLPHYVDFQSELTLLRGLKAERQKSEEMNGGEKKGRSPSKKPLAMQAGALSDYNFAYLDEQTKRMIRRTLLKAIAVPGHQVPFGSREMPLSYGWGTGAIQITASIIGPGDTLKVIDQGADDTTNAVSIRRFFALTAGVRTTTRTPEATLLQTRHRIPETPLREGQIIVYQVPLPEPLRFLEPRETETRKLHALGDYGIMYVKLYEDITHHGRIATSWNYPVKVHNRYLMSPSPIPKFDNPKMDRMPALQLFGAGREKRIYAVPPYTRVQSLDFEDHPFRVEASDRPCALCGSSGTFLDEIIVDDRGSRLFICSDTDYCRERREAGGSRADRTAAALVAEEER